MKDFRRYRAFFQLPAAECEKKIHSETMNSSSELFTNYFGDIKLSSITSEDILAFMSEVSDGTKQSTKKLRFTLLSAFFNYIKNSVDPDFQNPCDNPALAKAFQGREADPVQNP